MEQKQYNPAIDILRFISILAVILIHTTTRTLEINNLNVTEVPFTLFLNQVSRFAVPLFFMISGFVLELNYSENASYFFYLKKRLNRIFFPYVFWSGVYYYFVYTKHNDSFLHALTTGSSSWQLYFIPSLLILYVIFPLIHKFFKLLTNKWAIAILGTLQVIILYQDYYLHSIHFFYPISIAAFNFFVFLLGAFASHHQDKLIEPIRKWRVFLALATAAFGGYVFFEGYTLYLKTHNYLTFYSQWRPSVLIYTILIGWSLYYFFSRKDASYDFLKKLSKLSFFVFFIHIIILELIWYKVGIYIFQSNPGIFKQLWYDPLFFLSVSVISFGVAYIIHKIPYLSKFTG